MTEKQQCENTLESGIIHKKYMKIQIEHTLIYLFISKTSKLHFRILILTILNGKIDKIGLSRNQKDQLTKEHQSQSSISKSTLVIVLSITQATVCQKHIKLRKSRIRVIISNLQLQHYKTRKKNFRITVTKMNT